MHKLIYLRNVVSLELNDSKCTGCGMCMEVCPHAVFSMNGRRITIQDRDACIECGACSRNCPSDALSVRAGVGCAAAVINTLIGRKNDSCCCLVEAEETPFVKKNSTCCGPQ